MLKIDVSTHAESADKVVRITFYDDAMTFFVPMPEWSHALANVGQFSPETPSAGTTPVNWVEVV